MPTSTTSAAIGPDPFARATLAARELARRTGADHHDVVVVLGTGLAPVGLVLGDEEPPGVDLSALPWFVPFAGHGHQARAWSLELGGLQVLVSAGRLHLYEGYGPAEVAHLVRTAAAAGCRTAILTCAAGAIRPDIATGSITLVSDHLNLTGASPLAGVSTDHASGSPFVELGSAWSAGLRSVAREVEPTLAEGVYAQVPGPHLETPAEIRMLATLGADLVGMSMVLEAIAARHLGLDVLGLAVASNPAASLAGDVVSIAELMAVMAASVTPVAQLVRGVVERIAQKAVS